MLRSLDAQHPRIYDASLSTMWGIKRFDQFRDFFPVARDLGFAGIELNHQVDERMLLGLELSEQPIRSIHEPCPAAIPADVLKTQDLLISSLVEDRRRQGVDSIKRSIDLARQLGTAAVVVHSGQVLTDGAAENELRMLFSSERAGSPEYQHSKDDFIQRRSGLARPHMQAVKRSLLELLDYVGGAGIRLGLENRYHFLDIPGLEEMAELLELAPPDRLGFIYDVGHAQALDRLGFYSHEAWLKRYAGRMIGVHLHDVLGVSDHRAPGLGEVDFHSVGSYLPKTAFRTLELQGSNTPEQIQAGMEILVESGCVKLVQ